MTIRWGILGCGDVTEVKSGPALQLATDSSVVAVMRRTGALAEDYAKRHQVARWYDSADELFHDPEVNAIYIATPPGSHLAYALQAAEIGKPAYVEKPMARNFRECQQMVEAFQGRDLPLFVAYYRRALPRFLKVKEIIDSGILGTITGVQHRLEAPVPADFDTQTLPWRLVAPHSGGGLFFDLGSHALDLIDYLLGPLENVAGMASNGAALYDVEDTVVMHFRTGSGVLGLASWNFASSNTRDIVEIVGLKGSLRFAVFAQEPVCLRVDDQLKHFEIPHPPHVQQPLIQCVVNDLLGRGTCPSTGETAARTAAVMDQVVTNYYGDRKHDFWDAPDSWPGLKSWPRQ